MGLLKTLILICLLIGYIQTESEKDFEFAGESLSDDEDFLADEAGSGEGSGEIPPVVISKPTGIPALYRAVINVTSLEYTDEIAAAGRDISSLAVTQQLQDILTRLLSNIPGTIRIRIVDLQPGSLMVTFDVDTDGQQTEEEIRFLLDTVLQGGIMGELQVSKDGFEFRKIRDILTCSTEVGRDPSPLPETGNLWANLMINNQFPCNGFVVEWKYYRSSYFGTTYIGVFRQISDTEFVLIDKTVLPSEESVGYYTTKPDTPILVQKGDFIGVFHPQDSRGSIIPFARSGSDASIPDTQLYQNYYTTMYDGDLVKDRPFKITDFVYTENLATYALQAVMSYENVPAIVVTPRPVTCGTDQWQCANGECVPLQYRCDNQRDCYDGSDEENCPAPSCPIGEFQCADQQQCLPQQFVCNFVNDCADASDELNCGPAPVVILSFRQGTQPSSFEVSWIKPMQGGSPIISYTIRYRKVLVRSDTTIDGDYIVQSPLELFQAITISNPNQDKYTLSNLDPGSFYEVELRALNMIGESEPRALVFRTASAGCVPGEWQCQDGGCIPLEARCDNFPGDCADDSDEEGCYDEGRCNEGQVSCRLQDGSTVCRDEAVGCVVVCNENQFQCLDQLKCIEFSMLCDGRLDCDDSSDESNCECAEGEFQCVAGRQCISDRRRCDGIRDCDDASDEENCPCPTGTFQCLDTSTRVQCVTETLVCDGARDCADGSDELGCPTRPICRADQFGCADGTCIPAVMRCDGVPQCEDSSDEINCPGCQPNQFTCADGSCIPDRMRCDGVPQCEDSSDEVNCPGCRPDQFTCADGNCVEGNMRCDGVPQCEDSSDEEGCPCRDGMFQCRDGNCVEGNMRCDGTPQCEDGSDEEGCPATNCPASDFQCASTTLRNAIECIDRRLRCDGYTDCSDGSDEDDCPGCPGGQFTCVRTGQCVPGVARCNGSIECADRSDELDCVCTADQFRCGDGLCIDLSRRCDGSIDCNDRSDELACPCRTGEFQCLDGQCIPESRRCDNRLDCRDRSDEQNCPRNRRCPSGYFTCGTGQCLSLPRRCDGLSDCLDGSDEQNCSLRCAEDEMECVADNKCLTPDQICNRIFDCSDRRDEMNCDRCAETEFQCLSDRSCISAAGRCNRIKECSDGSDEMNCPTLPPVSLVISPQNLRIRAGAEAIFTCVAQGLPSGARVEWVRRGGELPMQSAVEGAKLMIPVAKPMDSGDYVCRAVGVAGSFQEVARLEVVAIGPQPTSEPGKCGRDEAVCQNGECIRREYRCDGEPDCSDGSDEPDDCFRNLCEPNEFQCPSGQCVMKIWRCDGEDDCGDGFDESNCAAKDPDEPCGFDEFQCLSGDQCIPLAYQCDQEIDCLDRSDEIGCSPPIITLPPVAEIEVELGATFTIICEAVGVPTPLIVWRLNWGNIPTGERVTVSSTEGRGILTIADARYEDAGAYTCEAINNRGSIFAIPDALVIVRLSTNRPITTDEVPIHTERIITIGGADDVQLNLVEEFVVISHPGNCQNNLKVTVDGPKLSTACGLTGQRTDIIYLGGQTVDLEIAREVVHIPRRGDIVPELLNDTTIVHFGSLPTDIVEEVKDIEVIGNVSSKSKDTRSVELKGKNRNKSNTEKQLFFVSLNYTCTGKLMLINVQGGKEVQCVIKETVRGQGSQSEKVNDGAKNEIMYRENTVKSDDFQYHKDIIDYQDYNLLSHFNDEINIEHQDIDKSQISLSQNIKQEGFASKVFGANQEMFQVEEIVGDIFNISNARNVRLGTNNQYVELGLGSSCETQIEVKVEGSSVIASCFGRNISITYLGKDKADFQFTREVILLADSRDWSKYQKEDFVIIYMGGFPRHIKKKEYEVISVAEIKSNVGSDSSGKPIHVFKNHGSNRFNRNQRQIILIAINRICPFNLSLSRQDKRIVKCEKIDHGKNHFIMELLYNKTFDIFKTNLGELEEPIFIINGTSPLTFIVEKETGETMIAPLGFTCQDKKYVLSNLGNKFVFTCREKTEFLYLQYVGKYPTDMYVSKLVLNEPITTFQPEIEQTYIDLTVNEGIRKRFEQKRMVEYYSNIYRYSESDIIKTMKFVGQDTSIYNDTTSRIEIGLSRGCDGKIDTKIIRGLHVIYCNYKTNVTSFSYQDITAQNTVHLNLHEESVNKSNVTEIVEFDSDNIIPEYRSDIVIEEKVSESISDIVSAGSTDEAINSFPNTEVIKVEAIEKTTSRSDLVLTSISVPNSEHFNVKTFGHLEASTPIASDNPLRSETQTETIFITGRKNRNQSKQEVIITSQSKREPKISKHNLVTNSPFETLLKIKEEKFSLQRPDQDVFNQSRYSRGRENINRTLERTGVNYKTQNVELEIRSNNSNQTLNDFLSCVTQRTKTMETSVIDGIRHNLVILTGKKPVIFSDVSSVSTNNSIEGYKHMNLNATDKRDDSSTQSESGKKIISIDRHVKNVYLEDGSRKVSVDFLDKCHHSYLVTKSLNNLKIKCKEKQITLEIHLYGSRDDLIEVKSQTRTIRTNQDINDRVEIHLAGFLDKIETDDSVSNWLYLQENSPVVIDIGYNHTSNANLEARSKGQNNMNVVKIGVKTDCRSGLFEQHTNGNGTIVYCSRRSDILPEEDVYDNKSLQKEHLVESLSVNKIIGNDIDGSTNNSKMMHIPSWINIDTLPVENNSNNNNSLRGKSYFLESDKKLNEGQIHISLKNTSINDNTLQSEVAQKSVLDGSRKIQNAFPDTELELIDTEDTEGNSEATSDMDKLYNVSTEKPGRRGDIDVEEYETKYQNDVTKQPYIQQHINEYQDGITINEPKAATSSHQNIINSASLSDETNHRSRLPYKVKLELDKAVSLNVGNHCKASVEAVSVKDGVLINFMLDKEKFQIHLPSDRKKISQNDFDYFGYLNESPYRKDDNETIVVSDRIVKIPDKYFKNKLLTLREVYLSSKNRYIKDLQNYLKQKNMKHQNTYLRPTSHKQNSHSITEFDSNVHNQQFTLHARTRRSFRNRRKFTDSGNIDTKRFYHRHNRSYKSRRLTGMSGPKHNNLNIPSLSGRRKEFPITEGVYDASKDVIKSHFSASRRMINAHTSKMDSENNGQNIFRENTDRQINGKKDTRRNKTNKIQLPKTKSNILLALAGKMNTLQPTTDNRLSKSLRRKNNRKRRIRLRNNKNRLSKKQSPATSEIVSIDRQENGPLKLKDVKSGNKKYLKNDGFMPSRGMAQNRDLLKNRTPVHDSGRGKSQKKADSKKIKLNPKPVFIPRHEEQLAFERQIQTNILMGTGIKLTSDGSIHNYVDMEVGQRGPCEPPFFNLGATSSDDCVRCFCFGQSVQCFSSDLQVSNIGLVNPVTLVRRDRPEDVPDNVVNFKANTREYQVLDFSRVLRQGDYYWSLPTEFLGERLTSYGGELKYTIFYDTDSRRPVPTNSADVILKGNGITLYYRARTLPNAGVPTSISVPLIESAWERFDGTIRGDTPIAQFTSREEFMTVLQNIEAIHVRASYDTRQSTVRIGGIFMTTAVDYSTDLGQAYLVEACQCPTGYTGLSCQTCAPGFTRIQSGGFLGQCIPCNCNGHSNDCDSVTGRCLNCQHNTYGDQCQLCVDGYYGDARGGTPNDCRPCPCPLTEAPNQFSRTCFLDTDGEVTCGNCPTGYTGRRCERCDEGYRGDPLTPGSTCQLIDVEEVCDIRGSLSANPDPLTRECRCKDNVMGRRCDTCKEDTFYLNNNYDLGCIQCFCMGVSKSCQSTYWNRAQVGVSFSQDDAGVTIADAQGEQVEGQRLQVDTNNREVIYRVPSDSDIIYWSLPNRFLGDKVTAYGGSLRFTLRYNSRQGAAVDSREPLVMITGNEITLLYRQGQTLRPNRPQAFNVVMYEQNWYRADGQPATREHLLMALADLDTILIRASFEEQQGDAGLRDVTLDIAEDRRTRQDRAYAVEQCVCPVGYRGLSCEDCDTGYTRSGGGLYLGLCVPCDCNGHSNECDPESGVCRNCQHNTAGDYCDQCAVGYYGDATRGTRNDCQKCPCPLTEAPNQFSPTCILADDGQVTCTACPAGHTGRRCETCISGYTGNPLNPGDYCKIGPQSDCDCDTRGTVPNTQCDVDTQQCQCKPYTQGRRCARCREGYFYLEANNPQGCLPCFCSGITNQCTSSSYYRDALRPVFGEDGSHNFVLMNRRMNNIISDGFVVNTARNQITFNQFEGVQRERESLFFQLPAKFRGDRVTSYGGYLRFTLEFSARPEGRTSRDVDLEIISAGQALRLYNLFEPPLQEGRTQTYEILLRESSFNDLRSNTAPTRATFMTILSNVEGFLIRATYHTSMASVTLRDLSMDTAIPTPTDLGGAPMVEDCRCPEGYTGLSCERCAQGYLRVSDGRGGLGRCVQCNCNGHATSCDPDSGRCLDCQHNTEGDRCEVCKAGYYGDATSGTPNDCRECPCPLTTPQNQFSRTCFLAEDNQVTCDRCPTGYTGRQCERCAEGYTGDPTQPGDSCRPIDLGERPEVTVSPIRVEEPVGSAAVFQCLVGGPGPFRVVWSRLDSRQLSDRASVSPRYTLTIRNLQTEDTGRYVCTASNAYGVTRGTVTLQVNTGPSPIQVRIDTPRLEIEEGRTARLVCTAVSTSRETTYILSWSKQNGQMPAKALDQNGVLLIPNIQKSDEGSYVCMGSDMFTMDEEVAVILVTDAGDQAPSVRIDPRYQTVEEGTPARFACIVTGSPRPTIEWYRGGNTEMNPDAIITDDGIFRIPRVMESDESDYYCKATNEAGTTEVRTILYVKRAPRPDINVIVRRTTVVVIAGRTARLECYTDDTTGRITLFWSRTNGLPPGSSQDNGVLTIPSVQQSYGGRYICTGTDVDTGRVNTAITTLEVNVDTPSEAPSVSVEPEQLNIAMGTTGTLRCVATGIPEPTVTWIKSREDLSPNHQVTGNTLRITQATMEDRGIYVCRAENSVGMNQDWAIVEVERRMRPKIDIYPNTTQTTVVGGSALFQCRVMDGDPPPRITWTRVGGIQMTDKTEIMDNGVIMFKDVTQSEQGSYICSATNDMGTVTATVTLVVQGPPSITLQPSQTVYALIGERVTLECTAAGEPTPQVYWIEPTSIRRGDLPPDVSLGESYPTSDGSAILDIASVDRDDQGYYRCIAANEGGRSEESVQLIVQEGSRDRAGVRISGPSTLSVTEGQSVELVCSAEAIRGASIRWSRREGALPPGHTVRNGVLTIPQFRAEYAGEYICSTVVPAGRFEASVFIIVTVAPRLVISPQRVTARAGETIILRCQASGSGPFDIEWMKVGGQMNPRATESGGILEIRQATAADAGRYRCVVRSTTAGTTEGFAIVDIEVPPQVAIGQRNVRVTPGSTAEFRCSVTGSPTPVVRWDKEIGDLPPQHSIQNGILTIFNVQPEDSGRYICTATSSAGSNRDSGVLSVESGGLINGGRIQSDTQVVNVGDRVSMECIVTGTPLPRITWSREDGALPKDAIVGDGVLIIPQAKIEDAGTYTCLAVNEAGSVTSQVNLFVRVNATNIDDDSQPFVNAPSARTAALGDSVSLVCEASGYPSPDITWMRKEGEMPDDYTIVDGNLLISRVRPEDAGTYVCRAENQYGKTETPVDLSVGALVPYFAQDPSSYMTYKPLNDVYLDFDILLSLRPESSEGMVLYNGQFEDGGGDFVCFGLNEGYPEFRFDVGSGPAIIRANQTLGLNQWHTIKLKRNRKQGEMVVNDRARYTGESPGFFTGLDLTQNMYLGAVPDYNKIPQAAGFKEGFVGSISEVKIKGIDLNLGAEALEIVGIDPYNACSLRPCQNGGLCLPANTRFGFQCMCKQGFTGDRCQEIGMSCHQGACGAGRCYDLEDASGFKCICPLGKTGAGCNIDIAIINPFFNRTSFISYPPAEDALFSLTIYIEFKPYTLSDGVILYEGNSRDGTGDYMALIQKDGYLEFRFDTGSGPAIVRSRYPLRLNEWTRVTATRTNKEGSLTVNDQAAVKARVQGFQRDQGYNGPGYYRYYNHIFKRYKRGTSPGSTVGLNLKLPLYLGGPDPTYPVATSVGVKQGFIGCVAELQINDNKIDLLNDAIESLNIVDCGERRLCERQPCENDAVCEDLPGPSYRCICPPTHTGRNCEIEINICLTNSPCQNGAPCSITDTGYRCDCPLGFAGVNCEIAVDITTSMGFMGDGYIEFRKDMLPHANTQERQTVSFTIKTTSPDGLILWQGEPGGRPLRGGDHFAIGLKGGFVEFRYEMGSGPAVLTANRRRVDDGQEHKIAVERFGRTGSLTVDSDPAVFGESRGFLQMLNADGNIYVGGVSLIGPMTENKYSENFKGCISNIIIHNKGPLKPDNAERGYNVEPCDE